MKKIIGLTLGLLFAFFCGNAYADETSQYIEHTDNAIAKSISLTNELNAFTDSVIKSGNVPAEQKNLYDEKIKDFENMLKNDEYIVMYHYFYNSYDDDYIKYGGGVADIDKDLWDSQKYLSKYYYDYKLAHRRYAINVLLYTNGYRDLIGYLDNYTKLGNGSYYLDDMKVTVEYGIDVELDLTNAQYTISKNSDETYGYDSIKIVSPKGNAYFFIGYDENGDWDGWFSPTGRGIEINCKYDYGWKSFLLNTENKPEMIENEEILLSDIFFDMYLKQSSVNWEYKGIKFSGNGKNEYTISIKGDRIDNKGNISGVYYKWEQGHLGLEYPISFDDSEYYYRSSDSDVKAFLHYGETECRVIYSDKTVIIKTV